MLSTKPESRNPKPEQNAKPERRGSSVFDLDSDSRFVIRASDHPAVAAFLPFAAGVEGVAGRQVDRLDIAGAEPFAGAAAGSVVGVAGDPDRRNAMRPQQRRDQPAGALGEMPTSCGRIHVVADVAGVGLDVV